VTADVLNDADRDGPFLKESGGVDGPRFQIPVRPQDGVDAGEDIILAHPEAGGMTAGCFFLLLRASVTSASCPFTAREAISAGLSMTPRPKR
jgi:hypothetical protein